MKCPYCRELFKPTSGHQRYCKKKCKDRYYEKYLRGKKKRKKKGVPNAGWRCPDCGVERVLPFNPKVSWKKWLDYSCSCGYKIQ